MSSKDKSTPSLEVIAARIAYLGGAVTTLGDFLATIAAGIALKLVEQQSDSDNQSTIAATEEDLRQMNKQMDYLIRELRQIKKMMP